MQAPTCASVAPLVAAEPSDRSEGDQRCASGAHVCGSSSPALASGERGAPFGGGDGAPGGSAFGGDERTAAECAASSSVHCGSDASAPCTTATSTTLGAGFNMVCTVVGTGLLQLPYGLSLAGWAGVPLLILMAAMAAYTAHVLGRCFLILQMRQRRDALLDDAARLEDSPITSRPETRKKKHERKKRTWSDVWYQICPAAFSPRASPPCFLSPAGVREARAR